MYFLPVAQGFSPVIPDDYGRASHASIRTLFRMDSDTAIQASLTRYDEELLRAVAARLFKPRNQWPVDELIARAVETLANPPVIDRRIKDLPPSCRSLLAAVGLTRRLEWPVGRLLELLASMGHAEGLAPLLTLLDAGMVFPTVCKNNFSPPKHKSIRGRNKCIGRHNDLIAFFDVDQNGCHF